MVRMTAYAVALLLSPVVVHAQSHGCVENPSGQGIDATVIVPLPLQPRGRVAIAVPTQPAFGQTCVAVMPPVRDVLRGALPPAGDLLRDGDSGGRADVLREAAPVRRR